MNYERLSSSEFADYIELINKHERGIMNVKIINSTTDVSGAIEDAMNVTVGISKSSNGPAARFAKIAKLGHWSVFEHASVTFLVQGVSRVTQQQLTRHRMASFSIESERHVKVDRNQPDVFVTPKSITDNGMDAIWSTAINNSYLAYETMLEAGIPMEDARYVLPQATTGEIIMTMNVRELYHFFKLRMAPSAQWEIRKLAQTMFDICHEYWPETFNEEILHYAD